MKKTPRKMPYVYDKGKYHDKTIEELHLPDEHAANHTVCFLCWLLDRNLMSDRCRTESSDILSRYSAGAASIHDVYEWWDRVLLDDMLSDEGNAFAINYFDFDHGRYSQDYISGLKGDLPTELHVPYNEANYQKMRAIIDHAYAQWLKSRAV